MWPMLPQELVDRPNACVGRQPPHQQIDLRIVGRDHQDIGHRHLALVAIAIAERPADECRIAVEIRPTRLRSVCIDRLSELLNGRSTLGIR